MTALVWLWEAIPLRVGIALAPFAFIAGTVLRGQLIGV